MAVFQSAREAKEFLVSKIVEEAQRENIGLSELERKMLYFSETAWTLPDIYEVANEFDRTCDSDAYEAKVSRLVRNVDEWLSKTSPNQYEAWRAAIQILQREDHYLLVMVRQGLGTVRQASSRPPGDLARLWLTGFAIVSLFLLAVLVCLKYGIGLPDRGRVYGYVWMAALSAAITYVLFCGVIGKKRTDDLLSRLVEIVFRGSGSQNK